MSHFITIGTGVWVAIGAAIAALALGDIDPDARVLVAVLSVVGIAAAIAALPVLWSSRPRRAMYLLLLSVITPTYFAYPLSVLPLCWHFWSLATSLLRIGLPRRSTLQSTTEFASFGAG